MSTTRTIRTATTTALLLLMLLPLAGPAAAQDHTSPFEPFPYEEDAATFDLDVYAFDEYVEGRDGAQVTIYERGRRSRRVASGTTDVDGRVTFTLDRALVGRSFFVRIDAHDDWRPIADADSPAGSNAYSWDRREVRFTIELRDGVPTPVVRGGGRLPAASGHAHVVLWFQAEFDALEHGDRDRIF